MNVMELDIQEQSKTTTHARSAKPCYPLKENEMHTIHKFQLVVTDRQTIKMPAGAEILCIQVQYTTPCIWARVNTDCQPEQREFLIYGTGHEHTEETGRYIGTFQLHGGGLVFHLFEIMCETPF
jgi:hypothetical protein